MKQNHLKRLFLLILAAALAAALFYLLRIPNIPLGPIQIDPPPQLARKHLRERYICHISANDPHYRGERALSLFPSRGFFHLGNQVIIRYRIYHPSDDPRAYLKKPEETVGKNLVLSAFPSRQNGKWEGGSIIIEGPGIKIRKNSNPAPEPVKPIDIPPARLLAGKFILDDIATFQKPGRFTVTIRLNVYDQSKRGDISLTGQTSFNIKPAPPVSRRKSGEILMRVANALDTYFVDWSGYPAPARGKDRPLLSPGLTTPVAYLDDAAQRQARELSVFINPYYGRTAWIVAGRGPDRDWDIEPLFRSSRIFSFAEILDMSYDPTNGLLSSGDAILTSHDGELPKTADSFRIWGWKADRDALEKGRDLP